MATSKKTAKKTTTKAKKPVVKKVEVKEVSVVPETVTKETSVAKKFNIKKYAKYILIIIGIAAVLFGVYKYKGLLIAATVNGMPISRVEVIKELEKQGGNSIVQGLVRKKLLETEAKKKNIEVTQKDLDAKYKEIDEQFKQGGQSLEQYIAQSGGSKEDFIKDQLKFEVMLTKLIEDRVKVDAKEVENYIEQNKEQYKDRNMDDVKKEVTEMMKQNKLRSETSVYLEELVSKAKVEYFSYQNSFRL